MLEVKRLVERLPDAACCGTGHGVVSAVGWSQCRLTEALRQAVYRRVAAAPEVIAYAARGACCGRNNCGA